MNYLVDTNVLIRSVEPGSPHFQPARMAAALLRSQGHTLHVVPQNLYEFWVVCTRPTTANGLGKSAAEAALEIANLKRFFTFLPETPAIYPAWERYVTSYDVLGKPAHDARFVAAMHVHQVTHLLTFNPADFKRFPGVTAVVPTQVLAAASRQTP